MALRRAATPRLTTTFIITGRDSIIRYQLPEVQPMERDSKYEMALLGGWMYYSWDNYTSSDSGVDFTLNDINYVLPTGTWSRSLLECHIRGILESTGAKPEDFTLFELNYNGKLRLILGSTVVDFTMSNELAKVLGFPPDGTTYLGGTSTDGGHLPDFTARIESLCIQNSLIQASGWCGPNSTNCLFNIPIPDVPPYHRFELTQYNQEILWHPMENITGINGLEFWITDHTNTPININNTFVHLYIGIRRVPTHMEHPDQ